MGPGANKREEEGRQQLQQTSVQVVGRIVETGRGLVRRIDRQESWNRQQLRGFAYRRIRTRETPDGGGEQQTRPRRRRRRGRKRSSRIEWTGGAKEGKREREGREIEAAVQHSVRASEAQDDERHSNIIMGDRGRRMD